MEFKAKVMEFMAKVMEFKTRAPAKSRVSFQ